MNKLTKSADQETVKGLNSGNIDANDNDSQNNGATHDKVELQIRNLVNQEDKQTNPAVIKDNSVLDKDAKGENNVFNW